MLRRVCSHRFARVLVTEGKPQPLQKCSLKPPRSEPEQQHGRRERVSARVTNLCLALGLNWPEIEARAPASLQLQIKPHPVFFFLPSPSRPARGDGWIRPAACIFPPPEGFINPPTSDSTRFPSFLSPHSTAHRTITARIGSPSRSLPAPLPPRRLTSLVGPPVH